MFRPPFDRPLSSGGIGSGFHKKVQIQLLGAQSSQMLSQHGDILQVEDTVSGQFGPKIGCSPQHAGGNPLRHALVVGDVIRGDSSNTKYQAIVSGFQPQILKWIKRNWKSLAIPQVENDGGVHLVPLFVMGLGETVAAAIGNKQLRHGRKPGHRPPPSISIPYTPSHPLGLESAS